MNCGVRIAFAACALICATSAQPQSLSFQPEVQLESRGFFEGPRFPNQFDGLQSGAVLTGQMRWTSEDRRSRFRLEPYLRLDDQDSERSYFDIREAAWTYRGRTWDFMAGVGQVFWGVAESRNVVDIVNQFDTIEDFDQGEKLGQPMLRLSRRGSFGSFEGFYLPYFREQRFPGLDGRIRFGLPVNDSASEFERSGDKWAGDWAIRYANQFGDFDVGLHAFYGTGRNPFFSFDGGDPLQPVYQRRRQAGVDVQYTRGPWLLKLETVGVKQGSDNFTSAVGGFEYTFFDMRRSGIDLGVIAEYLYDDRDFERTPVTLFEDDLFVGGRITLNDTQDTEILFGSIYDLETDASLASIEFQRRLGSVYLLEVEGRAFHSGSDFIVSNFEDDSHLTLRLTYYF